MLLAAAITFKSFNQLGSDYDLFWHLLMGEDMIKKGVIERFDIYSFTSFGHSVFNHEWLSEVIMTACYKLGGEWGIIFWRWIMTGLIVALAVHLISLISKSGLNRIVIFLCFVLVLRPAVSFRVQLFTVVMLLVLLNFIYAAAIRDRLPKILWIGLLFVLWANLHGAFVLGLLVWFAYVGEYVLKERSVFGLKNVIAAALVPVLVTLVNPYGIKLWWFILSELSNPISSEYISEWQRFSFQPRELAFFLVCLLSWAAYLKSGREKRAAQTALLVLASVMGFSSVRHTPLFVVLCLPVMADHFDGVLLNIRGHVKDGKALSGIWINFVAGVFVFFSVIFFTLGIPDTWQIDVEKDELPFQLVHFIKTNQMKGNLFVPLHWGGYVLFHLYPEVKVSIDGRWAMIYPHDVMRDNMDFAYNGKDGKWKQILGTYKADYALVETGNPAFFEMEGDPEWTFMVATPEGALLVRKTFIESLPAPFVIPEKVLPSWP